MGVVGIFVLLGIAFALSNDRRRAVNGRILGWGLGLQFAMALFALRTRAGVRLFTFLNDLADAFVGFADAGIRFVFGDWPAATVVQTPMPGGGAGFRPAMVGFVLAVKVLPIIIFVASLMAVGYHLGIMQRIVALLARGLSKSMHISGAEALSTVGDIFLGMTEAPLLVRPYVARMTESELFAVMCAGMATISGSVLLAYVAMGVDAGYLDHGVVHERAGGRHVREDHDPRDGDARDLGRRARLGPAPRRQHRRRGGARRRRGAAAGAQRRRDADRLRRAGQHVRQGGQLAGRARRPPRLVAGAPRRHAADAARLGDGRPLERGAVRRPAPRHEDGAQRVHRLPDDDQPPGAAVGQEPAHRQLRALRLRQLRVVGHRAWAASAAWCPSGARIWRGSGSGRSSPARWRRSSPARSPG